MASRIPQAVGLIVLAAAATACRKPPARTPPQEVTVTSTTPQSARFWNGATVYFLLLDRFENGDPHNDRELGRVHDGAQLRNFEGGDLAGVLQKLNEGYFDSLGVSAIWMTPFVEQIHGSVDEGTGKTYGYHGYWARDWTAVDPAFGTKELLHAVVNAAHQRGIKMIMDAVINHPGPVTPEDPAWPESWVRTAPQCTYKSYASTTDCTLVPTLPDVITNSDMPVDLPPALIEKWKSEGRLAQEQASLDAFFQRTGYPRAPRYYIIKWLTDWVRDFGFDGYRIDTAKHFGESVSGEIRKEADIAYADWKAAHAGELRQSLPFYMVGEVYGYWLGAGRLYDFGDRTVDYFSHGYDGLINFSFKADAAGSLDSTFTRYAAALGSSGPLNGVTVLNYLSSHDDGGPYDPDRKDPFGAANRLLLAPGTAQIYYGDETARPLRIKGAEGDANLRSFMNWGDLRKDATAAILRHWRIVGRFRRAHPAVGAGEHHTLQAQPLIFSRILEADGRRDRVLVALDQPEGAKSIPVFDFFPDSTELVDEYSGLHATVSSGSVALNTPSTLVLLSEAPKPQ